MAGLRARAHLEAPLAVVAHVEAECGVELGRGGRGIRATVDAGTLLARRRLWATRWLRREPRGSATLELFHRLRRRNIVAVVLFVLVHRGELRVKLKHEEDDGYARAPSWGRTSGETEGTSEGQNHRSFPDPAVSIPVLVVVSPPLFLPTLPFAQN